MPTPPSISPMASHARAVPRPGLNASPPAEAPQRPLSCPTEIFEAIFSHVEDDRDIARLSVLNRPAFYAARNTFCSSVRQQHKREALEEACVPEYCDVFAKSAGTLRTSEHAVSLIPMLNIAEAKRVAKLVDGSVQSPILSVETATGRPPWTFAAIAAEDMTLPLISTFQIHLYWSTKLLIAQSFIPWFGPDIVELTVSADAASPAGIVELCRAVRPALPISLRVQAFTHDGAAELGIARRRLQALTIAAWPFEFDAWANALPQLPVDQLSVHINAIPDDDEPIAATTAVRWPQNLFNLTGPSSVLNEFGSLASRHSLNSVRLHGPHVAQLLPMVAGLSNLHHLWFEFEPEGDGNDAVNTNLIGHALRHAQWPPHLQCLTLARFVAGLPFAAVAWPKTLLELNLSGSKLNGASLLLPKGLQTLYLAGTFIGDGIKTTAVPDQLQHLYLFTWDLPANWGLNAVQRQFRCTVNEDDEIIDDLIESYADFQIDSD